MAAPLADSACEWAWPDVLSNFSSSCGCLSCSSLWVSSGTLLCYVICDSMMTNEAGHLFMCFLVTHTASFSEACVHFFMTKLKIGYWFLYYLVLNILFVSGNNSLVPYLIGIFFPPSCSLPFCFINDICPRAGVFEYYSLVCRGDNFTNKLCG